MLRSLTCPLASQPMFVPFTELFLPEKEPGEALCWQERNPQHLETEVVDDTGVLSQRLWREAPSLDSI